jgi:transposase-like protein
MVKKRETIMAQSLEDKIIGLYGLGMSLRDISNHIKETYDTDISAATLSNITDKVIPLVKEWQQRPLESLYCIVWLDAIYPQTEVQTCVVHQIRNSIKYVASKDQKSFMTDLKPVYRADNESQALGELEALKEKWGKKYPIVISSWENNWTKLSTYFKYPAGIRKLIYTTNTIEGYHRQIRKVTKTKGVFTSDMALLKLIYLATERIQRKWTMPLNNWSITASQLKIIFADRMKTDLWQFTVKRGGALLFNGSRPRLFLLQPNFF